MIKIVFKLEHKDIFFLVLNPKVEFLTKYTVTKLNVWNEALAKKSHNSHLLAFGS